jgi:hypothetical protein
MLHIRAQPWTFEKDMPAHWREYAELAPPVTSVCLRSWGRAGREMQEAAARGGLAATRALAAEAPKKSATR